MEIFEKRLAVANAKVRLYKLGRESAECFASSEKIFEDFQLKFAEQVPLATDEMMKIIQLGMEGGDMPTVEDLPGFVDRFIDATNTSTEYYTENVPFRIEAMEIAINAYKKFVAAGNYYSKCSTEYLQGELANVK